MRQLSDTQVRALEWAAFKDGAQPPRAALDQMAELGLITPPVANHDPHWRPTGECFDELRARGLDRPRHGKKRALVPREAQAA